MFGVDAPSAGWEVVLSLLALVCALVAVVIGVTARAVVTVLLGASASLLAIYLLWQGLAFS